MHKELQQQVNYLLAYHNSRNETILSFHFREDNIAFAYFEDGSYSTMSSIEDFINPTGEFDDRTNHDNF